LRSRTANFWPFIGLSGSGKSDPAALYQPPDRAHGREVVWDGVDITAASGTELRKVRRRIGMIFQQFNLVSARPSSPTCSLAGWATSTPVQSLFNYFSPSDRARALAASIKST